MKKSYFLWSLLGLLTLQLGWAQQKTITGTVNDETGLPLPGATVVVDGTTRGVTTDFDGNFTVSLETNQSIEISYVGYVNQLIQFTGQDSVNVVLQEDLNELDEIVVTGYGTRKRSQLTGAVAKIGGGEVAAVQTARVDDALAGKLSGVLIQNQDGSPGAAPKIQIRAASSISGASNPLASLPFLIMDTFMIVSF